MSDISPTLKAALNALLEEARKRAADETLARHPRLSIVIPSRSGKVAMAVAFDKAEREFMERTGLDESTPKLEVRRKFFAHKPLPLEAFGVEIGNMLMSEMMHELYRRQYREERALPWFEQPVLGGES